MLYLVCPGPGRHSDGGPHGVHPGGVEVEGQQAAAQSGQEAVLGQRVQQSLDSSGIIITIIS